MAGMGMMALPGMVGMGMPGMGMGMMGMPGMGMLVPANMPQPGQPGYAGAQIAMLAQQAMKSQMEAAKNPEVVKIQTRMAEIAALLAQPDLESVQMSQRYSPDKGDWIQMDGGRSPSPPPAYDRTGKRINTRDVRLRDTLQKERVALMEKLAKLQPNNPMNFMPKPKVKISNKIFVPVKEYPGYPFVGLILGPRGNTQKKMERETGARIVIRGKGSVKAGRKMTHAPDPSEDEDMHVYITADDQESVDAASKIISELLQPKEDQDNDWKRVQLRELAMINGTLRDENDHFKDEMRQLARTQNGGPGGGATVDAPWRLNVEQQEQQMSRDWNTMQGGSAAGPRGGLGMRPPQPGDAPPWQRGPRPPQPPGGGPEMDGDYGQFLNELSGNPSMGGQARAPTMGTRDQGDCAVWVGGLPAHYDDGALHQLFVPYGEVRSASVVRDRQTGTSRNFGFVNFNTQQEGVAAIEAVNNLRIQDFDGRTVHARLKGTTGAPPMGGGSMGGGMLGGGAAPPWGNRPAQPPGMPPGNNPYGPPPGGRPPQPPGMPPGMPGMPPGFAGISGGTLLSMPPGMAGKPGMPTMGPGMGMPPGMSGMPPGMSGMPPGMPGMPPGGMPPGGMPPGGMPPGGMPPGGMPPGGPPGMPGMPRMGGMQQPQQPQQPPGAMPWNQNQPQTQQPQMPGAMPQQPPGSMPWNQPQAQQPQMPGATPWGQPQAQQPQGAMPWGQPQQQQQQSKAMDAEYGNFLTELGGPPAPSNGPAPIPSSWQEAIDPGSGKTYYINHETKATSWERPT